MSADETPERPREQDEPPSDSMPKHAFQRTASELSNQQVEINYLNQPPPDSERVKMILIAGVGNAWMGDDGFGAEVVKRLGELELPRGAVVMDFGTGGLNLAYEVMNGYDALMILDISEQGGAPGSLYVIEADEDSIDGNIEDGDSINPHGMDPKSMLRFVKSIGAWPGKVVVIACEPHTVAEIGFQLSESVAGAVEPAVELVLKTIAELQTDAAYQSAE
ncbi:MAG TPA: hydrogenase maturation protease [Solirubrobacteraceae bacterium]|jgi:hydrogenase maturation protease|nr:hydrogenase maturation protease [Solirubrobacteraceae bacterium]